MNAFGQFLKGWGRAAKKKKRNDRSPPSPAKTTPIPERQTVVA